MNQNDFKNLEGHLDLWHVYDSILDLRQNYDFNKRTISKNPESKMVATLTCLAILWFFWWQSYG
ncbi:MAG: hypothetical protein QNJ55_28910 [Xenococcus sp. MO_188.B8]|nr:hypothetical protein [Xenococcus sp. MO_188.B8]